MQADDRLPPLVAIDQVVPVRDQVIDRAALMAERDAAIHAARGLGAQFQLRQRMHEFAPASGAHRRLGIAAIRAFDLQKSSRLAHAVTLAKTVPAAKPVNNAAVIFMMPHLAADINAVAAKPLPVAARAGNCFGSSEPIR
jgi:hypothetical protein